MVIFGILVCRRLLSVAYLLPTPEAWIIYLKSYIILNWLNLAWFLIVEALCLGRANHWPMSEKKNHKNEQNLCLVTHIFTKLSQNVYLINTLIFIYYHSRCYRKLWSLYWFECIFQEFSYIIDEYSCVKYCIFTKLSQMMCLINVHILIC